MTRKDIDRIFTDTVAALLAKGYRFHTATMGGSQGEIAKADLTDGSEILRALMYTEPRYGEGYGDTLVIKVGRYTEGDGRGRDIIWNERLETLSEIRLAKISDDFYTDLESGRHMAEVRYARWRSRGNRHSCDRREVSGDAYKSIALRWLRRQPRMRSCQLGDIARMYARRTSTGAVCYEIEARGKTYWLQARHA